MNRRGSLHLSLLIFILTALYHNTIRAQAELPSVLQQRVDTLVAGVLARTGVPSASIAIVRDDQTVFTKAYGDARIEPRVPATPEMRYGIGSISKQFLATAMLLLQEEGKLSLDDRIAKYIPDLTRAGEITIRQLLTHTSGYQDYWPQDYVMKSMLQPTTERAILDQWGRKALDFDPGTKWQYSNTNYVIAGVILEKVTGQSVFQFLKERMFAPLGMNSVSDIDQGKLSTTDPLGYMRYALGELRVGPSSGAGWLFSTGELAMTQRDLAKWDISIIDRKVLQPSTYRQLETEEVLRNGTGTHYGLGIDVGMFDGHLALTHSGEVSGFTSMNMIFPDDRLAVVVLTNQDAVPAYSAIAIGLSKMFLGSEESNTAVQTEQAQKIFEGLQKGTIDRSLFTENANGYFSEEALKDFSSSLGPLGSPQEFKQIRQALRGGMTLRMYRISFEHNTLRAWTYEMPDGKLEQYQVSEEE